MSTLRPESRKRHSNRIKPGGGPRRRDTNGGLHVNQIRRYEAGTAQPTLDALVSLAKALHVSLDDLVFEEDERGPSDDMRLQFEAVSQLPEEDRKIVKALIEGMVIKYQARRMVENLSS